MKNYKIQTILFDKNKFNIAKAKLWLKQHYFKYNDTDEKENYIRFRQEQPSIMKKQGFINYYSKTLNNGIILVFVHK